MQISFALENAPDEETRFALDNGLDDFNAERVGLDNADDLWVVARSAENAVLGGLKAKTAYSWMFIDWLWVSPSSRGSGLGTKLIERAEAAAKERGCIGAYVDTFSFQAPRFYELLGYEEFGRIRDFPPGHSCIWLRKRW